jgi:glycosyltransferase involved in cell wall biosynthesis
MTSPSPPLRVCFTALNAYPLFDARATAPVGGMETRACTLARGLAAQRGFDVQFVVEAPWWFRSREADITVWNHGDGFESLRRDVAQSVERIGGFPWMRVRRWRASLAWQLPLLAVLRLIRGRRRHPFWPAPIYRQIKADVHCCFGVSATSATVIASSLAADRPSILFLAANSDLDARHASQPDFVDRNGVSSSAALFCLRKASIVVAQQETQRQLLRERFERDCALLPGAIDLAAWDAGAAQMNAAALSLPRRYVLWIGRADDFHKRPALCLAVARKLPEVCFVMILNRANAAVERAIHAEKPANVTIIESVRFAEMPVVMSRAAALLSTSAADQEGAPNVFLQAAAARVPIVSLEATLPLLEMVAPECVLQGDLERTARLLGDLWSGTPGRAQAIGAGLRSYVEQHHGVPVVIEELSKLLHAVVAGARCDETG